jgi:hypothetical protein
MTAFLATIPGPIKTALLWALAAFVLVSGSYVYGKHVGTQQAAVSALETSVKVLRKRNEIDETVSTSDASALCSDFGLSDDDQAECVRRVLETNAEP